MICPACATVVPPVVWRLIAAFLAAPFAIVAVVVVAIRRVDRRGPRPELARDGADRAPTE
jgi:hypothetical protein